MGPDGDMTTVGVGTVCRIIMVHVSLPIISYIVTIVVVDTHAKKVKVVCTNL